MNMSKEIQGIVEIGNKPIVERKATATGLLNLQEGSKKAIVDKMVKKGDVLEASTIAAIQAVKDTPRIIPHCHPIPLEGCKVDWAWEGTSLRCTVHVSAHYKTGIEMEALTGVRQQIQWLARNCGPFFCVTNDSRRMFYTVFLAKKSRSSHVEFAVLS